ncbi:MAG: tetraacyldisaccharide 4'-kinase [Syntrophus sp. (in: bacteria)]|nr:tetraacyldisaccharide 4'-kinase [Syntrophus sp. (in: bacteria)]
MRNTIIRVWNGEAKYARWILYIPLAFFSYLYQIALIVRELMYKSGAIAIEKAVIPVISVGNISLGGTGKTPVVERLSQKLKEEGLNPGIITRGYKRKKKGTFVVDIQKDTAETAGDEAFMLAKKTNIPVIVGKNRLEAIETGVRSFHIDIAILDDGFQVKNLEKDVDLLILNGKETPENHELFPLGPYREPFMRIRDCDAILINKGGSGKGVIPFAGNIPKFKVSYKPVHVYNLTKKLIAPYTYLKGARVAAFSGLGDNRSFFKLLKDIGADVVHEISFPDHHRYTARDIKKCVSFNDVDFIITTEKDAVKITHMDIPENLFYLSIEVAIENEEKLIGLLLKKIGIAPRRLISKGIDSQQGGFRGSKIIQ